MAGQRGPDRLTCRGWPQLGTAPGTPSGAGEACLAPRRHQEGTKKAARASCGAWPVCRHGAAPALELERDALAGSLPVGRRGEGLRREAMWLRPRPAGGLRRPLSAGSPEASFSARSCLYRLPQASARLGHSSPRAALGLVSRWPHRSSFLHGRGRPRGRATRARRARRSQSSAGAIEIAIEVAARHASARGTRQSPRGAAASTR